MGRTAPARDAGLLPVPLRQFVEGVDRYLGQGNDGAPGGYGFRTVLGLADQSARILLVDRFQKGMALEHCPRTLTTEEAKASGPVISGADRPEAELRRHP
jgi:hypothetical protein